MVRGALRMAAGTASLVAGSWLVRALHGAPAALGADPASIRAVAQGSPNYHEGVFVNLDPASIYKMDREQLQLIMWELLANRGGSRPAAPIPLAAPAVFDGDPSRLAVSWFGHSTALLELDGYRVLTDPVWSDRCSPSDVVGPQRLHPPPVQLEGLPAVDAVVISHDHYDHLDIDTVMALTHTQRAPFFVPLGVGAHLRAWGIPEQRIVELDWGQSAQLDELTVICMPARHFSGRFLDRNTTLWASWAFVGPRQRAYFGGDTGYTKSFAEIGADHGPFDLTLHAHRGLQHRLAGHPHESRGGGAGAPGRHRLRFGAVGADPLGHLPAGSPPVGRAGRADAQGGRRRRGRGGGADTRSTCRPGGAGQVHPVVAALIP